MSCATAHAYAGVAANALAIVSSPTEIDVIPVSVRNETQNTGSKLPVAQRVPVSIISNWRWY